MQASKTSRRVFIYSALWLLQLICFIRAAYTAAGGLIQITFTKSFADEDIALIKSQVIPYFSDPRHQNAAVKTLTGNNLAIDQLMSDALAGVEQLFMYAAAWLFAALVLSFIIHRVFPDRKELRKVDMLPGLPKIWKRPIRFR
jgi:hypothetical protein